MLAQSSSKPRLPWFVRLGDRVIDRHERWVTEMRDSREFHEKLLRFATTGDENARAWVAEALSRYDYARASRVWMWYLFTLLLVALAAVAGGGLRGCGLVPLLLLPVPLFVRFDRWNRRRKAWNGLGEGKAWIYEKVEVKAPARGSRVFQSYWTRGDAGRLELDHPIELHDAIDDANEWWQWEMAMPHDDSGRVSWRRVFMDLGLVHRDETGARRLVAGGVVYFSYDPVSGRIDTSGYE